MSSEMDKMKKRLGQETKVKAVIATETNRNLDVGALIQAKKRKAMSNLPPASAANKSNPTPM